MQVKVVVNKCFGGFGLSREALSWLHERGMPGISKPTKELDKAEVDRYVLFGGTLADDGRPCSIISVAAALPNFAVIPSWSSVWRNWG